ncbi:hypothetical protein AYL99_02595 [Fonsecaea erecta]|uniref:CENP-V/GFA domain-containing protein n=1 Tax=Fonsecaea erecta TaxID=1367422 RepID=A0A178ZUD1_9EURO|nr:hypothetical protein AYL99_02595 [Fonsecaea erecta]OAP63368.1 hypothetical protein AYL99_02595 [Fonsecaea erecta]
MEGECLCKAVAVKVNDDNLFGEQRRGHICHCANCRKVAGGIFGVNLTIEQEKVEFPKGKGNLKMYSSCASGVNSALTRYMYNKQDPETLSGTPVQRYGGDPSLHDLPYIRAFFALRDPNKFPDLTRGSPPGISARRAACPS